MARELRMSATIPLPDDAFKQAAILAKIEPARAAFEEALTAANSAGKVEVEARIVASQVRLKKGESAPAGGTPVVEEDREPDRAAPAPAPVTAPDAVPGTTAQAGAGGGSDVAEHSGKTKRPHAA